MIMDYSCSAKVCVRTLIDKQVYFVSIIIHTSAFAHDQAGTPDGISMVGIPEDLHIAYGISALG